MSEIAVDRKTLVNVLSQSFKELSKVLDNIDEDLVNKPQGSRWTIGQVLEHLIKVQVGTIYVLRGPSNSIKRDPAEKVEYIQQIFADESSRYKAGERVSPNSEPKELSRMSAKFKSNLNAMEFQVMERDMTNEFTGFEHYHFGFLTGIEWVYFEAAHTARHIRQIMKLI